MTYLITFACYGSHLHGDESGSVDRNHSVPGHRTLDTDAARVAHERDLMDQPPYLLDDEFWRTAVLDAIQGVCSHRHWALLAAHVRSTHVHVVVDAEAKPEKVMNDFKSYASRRLHQIGAGSPGRKRWARHGSTRWLWNRDDIGAAIRYVVEEQGEPMAMFIAQT
ncbi:MAG: transposase [Bryobacteraceae bacterium]